MYCSNPRKRARQPPSPDDLERNILKELKSDEDDPFGQSIGVSLKKMTPQQKALAKMKIQQL